MEFAEEAERRTVVVERWRSTLGMSFDASGDTAAGLAALLDAVRASAEPHEAVSVALQAVPSFELDRLSLGYDTGPQVVTTGWLIGTVLLTATHPSQVAARTSRSLLHAYRPLVIGTCRTQRITPSTAWDAVTRTVHRILAEAARGSQVPAAVGHSRTG